MLLVPSASLETRGCMGQRCAQEWPSEARSPWLRTKRGVVRTWVHDGVCICIHDAHTQVEFGDSWGVQLLWLLLLLRVAV